MSTATQKKVDRQENNLVEGMKHARQIAVKFFGERATPFVVQEIYEYLEEADKDAEEEFIYDLTRFIEHAKDIYETAAPTGEVVFDLLERYLNAE